jgi:catechol 2,3-dioxygenase-like lactoylglutathione lyase family enzyme
VSTATVQIRKIGTVVVPISDQERAIDFYVNTLGFEKRADVAMGDAYRWVEVAPAGADTTIAIVPPPPGTPAGDMQTGIALQTTDIEALHAELKARGVDVDAEVSRMATPCRRCAGSATPTTTRSCSWRSRPRRSPRRAGPRAGAARAPDQPEPSRLRLRCWTPGPPYG